MSYQFQTENKLKLSSKRLSVEYSIFADSETEAREKATDITIEQTVEFPEDLLPERIISEGMIGKIEHFLKISKREYTCIISFANECAGNELTQFINVLFGNISIKPGIKIQKIILSDDLDFIKGPRFGITKLRSMWKIKNRPLLCSALKPMGLSNDDLALLAGDFARGGVDLIKDDHGLANQKFTHFEERVEKCQKAIDKNNSATIYAPNISGPYEEVKKRAHFAKSVGCKALLISPALAGFDAVRMLRDDNELALPLIAHPAFIGSLLTSNENGFSHYALLGQMMRILGADVSIYPNFGGRFSFSKIECQSIVKGCTDNLLNLESIFPCPGGGMNFQNIPEMLSFYGPDVIYLMGGGLFRRGDDLVKSTKELKHLITN